MRLAAIALLLLAAPTVFAQADRSARQVLDDCVESIDYEVIGLKAIETSCPGLIAALEELDLAPLISEQQRAVIGLNGLESLQSLDQRYREVPEAGAVTVDSLQSVLDSLQKPPPKVEPPLTWFERFKRWLRGSLDNGDGSSESWLDRLFNEYELTETMRTVLFYGSVLLVVLLAIVVIVNEVRVARRARRKSRSTRNTNVGADGKVLTNDLDFDAAARSDRPSLVFRMLVATLIKTGRLQTERSLTHRELTLKARFDDSQQRESFQRVAELAERIVYGGDAASADDLDYVVEAGRTLNSQLGGAAT